MTRSFPSAAFAFAIAVRLPDVSPWCSAPLTVTMNTLSFANGGKKHTPKLPLGLDGARSRKAPGGRGRRKLIQSHELAHEVLLVRRSLSKLNFDKIGKAFGKGGCAFGCDPNMSRHFSHQHNAHTGIFAVDDSPTEKGPGSPGQKIKFRPKFRWRLPWEMANFN